MFKSIIDKNKSNLIFLHGWGGSWQSWYPSLQTLKKDYNLYAPDLPGSTFNPIDKPFYLQDYVNFITKYIKKNHIKKPILVGHSFGGAIACKIAINSQNLLSKIILVDAAPIRHPYSLPQKIKFKTLGLLKKLFPFTKNFYYKISGLQNSDYAALKNNPILQQTFKNIIQDDLTSKLSKIKVPTLIIWGKNDLDTPLSDGLTIQKLISYSHLEIIKNAGHFSYLDDQTKFITEVKKFINL